MTMAIGPALLCFDGSENAVHAIAQAGERLAATPAIVLTVCEPIANWEPYDPLTVLSAPLSKLGSRAIDLDAAFLEVAQATMQDGVARAQAAGFEAHGRTAPGKPWQVICDIAEEIDASTIVLGARGRSEVQSVLLGSVSAAVATHADRPVLIVPRARD
jgi:nucleotide-binding universal stress UspA family protein